MPKILIKRGTSAQWTASTTALLAGELGLDTSNNILKVGNGTSLWNSLSGLTLTSTQISELAQDAISTALSNGIHSNITVTYNDNLNSISLATGPDVVTTTSLNNTLTNPSTGYVAVADVGNPDGVAPLDENSLIPDAYIPSTIARDSELFRSAVEWTANHYQLSGGANTRYLAGDVVWHNGNIYIANYDNESLPTSNTQYWTILGTGKRLNIDCRDIPNITYDQLNGKPVIPDLTGYATETYVGTAISNLVDSAPTTLNTLNELAAALGDDPNYATTITTALGNKLDSTAASSTYLTQTNAASTYAPLASPTFTGTVTLPTETIASSDLHWEHYANESDLPAASAKHGMFAHVHGTGGAYFAHAGAWYKLAKQSDVDLKSDEIVTINAQTSSYTLNVLDLDKMIEMSGGGTLTITDSASFPIGFTCNILQTGSSQVTVAGNGFTVNATPGLKLRTQWSSATLVKRALNSWVLMGDLSA